MSARNIALSAAFLVDRAPSSADHPFRGHTAPHQPKDYALSSGVKAFIRRIGPSLAKSAVVAGLALPFTLSATVADAASAQRKIVVQADSGGAVSQRIATIQAFRKQGVRVHIEGQCNSSCTPFLGMPQTCVSRQTRLEFHGTMSPFAGKHSEDFKREAVRIAMHSDLTRR